MSLNIEITAIAQARRISIVQSLMQENEDLRAENENLRAMLTEQGVVLEDEEGEIL